MCVCIKRYPSYSLTLSHGVCTPFLIWKEGGGGGGGFHCCLVSVNGVCMLIGYLRATGESHPVHLAQRSTHWWNDYQVNPQKRNNTNRETGSHYVSYITTSNSITDSLSNIPYLNPRPWYGADIANISSEYWWSAKVSHFTTCWGILFCNKLLVVSLFASQYDTRWHNREMTLNWQEINRQIRGKL